MRILGVDPGSRATGWALLTLDAGPRLVAAGVLRPPTSQAFALRLRALHAALLDVLAREKPDVAVVERVFSGVNPQSLIALGEARGVILLALAQRDIATAEITPAEIKRAVTGSGKAEKQQVRRMVAALVENTSGRPRLALDAADAAAAALAHGFLTVRHGAVRSPTLAGPAPGGGRTVRRRVPG